MSHSPERKEKDCLNCGTIVHGRYCHICGQENKVPKESFWVLVLHFFYDLTHFDSSFFDTMKYLLFRPGFLPKEYMLGRRASYLNPLRMYIFTSAFFFLIFFAFKSPEEGIVVGNNIKITQAQRDSIQSVIDKRLAKDSSNIKLLQIQRLLSDSSYQLTNEDLLSISNDFKMLSITSSDYKSVSQYDSIQQALPEDKKDGWLKKVWTRKELAINEKYRKDPSSSMKKLSDIFMHKLPYLLFISLPFFALILKLLYIRCKWYYVDHVIFSVYHYIVSFLLLLFIFAFDELADHTGLKIFNFFIAVIVLIWLFYLYKSMRKFYGQGGLKTFMKFLLLNFLGYICLVLLLSIFVLFSIFQV